MCVKELIYYLRRELNLDALTKNKLKIELNTFHAPKEQLIIVTDVCFNNGKISTRNDYFNYYLITKECFPLILNIIKSHIEYFLYETDRLNKDGCKK